MNRQQSASNATIVQTSTDSSTATETQQIHLVANRNDLHVTFDSTAVDNENLGKKKSKICCIYRKPHDVDVSSDSDSSYDGNLYEYQPKY